MKVDLKKYFDKIYILTYYKCYKDRIPNIKKQFEDLFINGFDKKLIEIKNSFNSVLFRDLYNYYRSINNNLHDLDEHSLNVTVWHYLIIKEAYEFGYNHILVLEDDINFLKNTNYISEILNNLPQNYDIVQLHKGFLTKQNTTCKLIQYNDYYINYNNQQDILFYDNFLSVSSACNCFSRNGMKKFLDIFENLINYKSNIALICDTYYINLTDINYYICTSDLCICGNKTNNDYKNCLINNYKEQDYFYE